MRVVADNGVIVIIGIIVVLFSPTTRRSGRIEGDRLATRSLAWEEVS
jgi:hypothetical protein